MRPTAKLENSMETQPGWGQRLRSMNTDAITVDHTIVNGMFCILL